MALHWLTLNTFADVEEHYNSIKPIRGTNIRPLGDRARKWEHIKKVSKNKYILCDNLPASDFGGNEAYIWQEDAKGLEKRAAITWTRTKDGEYLTVRNGSGSWAHCSRYTFLDRVLPQGMYCSVEYGKQYIINNMTGDKQFLPKSKWVNKKYHDWVTNTTRWKPNFRFTTRDDKVHLTYKRGETTFMCVEGDHKVPVKRVRVNKEVKKPYIPAIQEFVEWAWDMRPTLEHTIGDWQAMATYRRKAGECIHNHEAFKRMLSDAQSEYRVPVLADMLNDMCSWDWSYSCRQLTTDPKKFRQAMNTRINRMGGFNVTTDEFKEV